MARKTLRRLLEKSLGSEWDQLLRRIRRRDAKRFLIFWNRGLGDIALGLCRVVDELRARVVDAEITVLTRAELADAFVLLPVDHVVVDPTLQRQDRSDARAVMARLHIPAGRFDLIVGRPDPTHWFRKAPRWQPRLRWPARCDALAGRFDAHWEGRERPTIDIAVHVSSETGLFYKYRKDWPVESWQAMFEAVQARHPVRFILLGHKAEPEFAGIACVDLRGKTSFLEMMAIIRQHCAILVAPDSGVLTMTYYLDGDAALGLVSLWADPRQGILKQGADSPNPGLRHHALLAPDERIENITVESVVAALETLLAHLPCRTGPILEEQCETV